MKLIRLFLAVSVASLWLPGCSRPEPEPAPPASVEAAITAKLLQAKKPTACALVSADEMSKIFGTALQAEAHEGAVDKTECIYKPSNAVSPYIELTVEWGEGETAMRAMGTMANVEPGIADPYSGIGDQAISVGTVLMVRTGNDLVSITFSGVDDVPTKARMIFDTLKAKL